MIKSLLAIVAALVGFAGTVHAATKPSFRVEPTSVSETALLVPIRIDKSAVASSYSKISVRTVDGTAKAGVDYTPINTTVTFSNSALWWSVPVAVIARPGYQGNRSFTVHIAAVRNATIAQADAAVTILESEQPPAPAPVPTAKWVFCAFQGNLCTVNGTANVRYGDVDLGLWTPSKSVVGSIFCDSSVFGDPKPGDSNKSCQTDGVPANPAPAPVPAPPPPPSPTAWVPAPLTVGGYACSKWQAGPCGSGIVYRITGAAMSADAVPVQQYTAVFYQDASGQFPRGDPFAVGFVGYWAASDLIGIAPAP